MGVKRIWTDKQKADIKYLYEEEGWTIKQIEKKVNKKFSKHIRFPSISVFLDKFF